VFDQGEVADPRLKVGFYRRPDAMFLKGTEWQSVFANVCGQCGHVELFVRKPAELYDAYIEATQPGAPLPSDAREKCLECGTPLGDSDRCPNCGWTYAVSPGRPGDAERSE
jgi:hypothetical protein